MRVNEALKKYDLIPRGYETRGKSIIVNTDKGKFVFKDVPFNGDIINYLKTRNFDYIPSYLNDVSCDDYQLCDYVSDLDIPSSQKIFDLISLVSLLHSKTTHYEEIDLSEVEQMYEDLDNNLSYLYGYYTDLITLIESKVYMSPSEYLLARNISKIYQMIDMCKADLDKWYLLVKGKRKRRNVVLHNNLSLDHFIRNENSYLISWEKAKVGSPVFDLYKLYLNEAINFDFEELFKEYEKRYPLYEEERMLLYILICMPPLIKFDRNEYDMCFLISKDIDVLYKSSIIRGK